MKPKLFRLDDLWLMMIPITITLVLIAALVWNLLPSSGEPIPIQGWAVSGAVLLCCWFFIFDFYRERWSFNRTYAYTAKPGLDCYYRDLTPYGQEIVEAEIQQTLDLWRSYFARDPEMEGEPLELFIQGVKVLFRPETFWITKRAGVLERKVAGLAGWNWFEVATGGRTIEKTAFAHELSHVLLNQISFETVDEDKAHEIFTKVGV